MISIRGQYNTALCFCDDIEASAEKQIRTLCDQEAFSDAVIRIMPDVHAGMGCTIGTTMTVTDKVVPGMVGVDIGCGVETVLLAQRRLEMERLDTLIREGIPSGRHVRILPHPLSQGAGLDELRCASFVDLKRARLSVGTLGGGNHFIEAGYGQDGTLYLTVHSGSRHLGKQVAEHYQKLAYDSMMDALGQGRPRGKKERRALERRLPVPKDMTYLTGRAFYDYLHDMKIVQHYASLNRQAMVETLLEGMDLEAVDSFTTIHNYIDTDTLILRKGAVAAQAGQRLLVPINMRDGSLLCLGKGNREWNQSAPHGAGRLMSRREAFSSLSMEAYRRAMKGIYSTSVHKETLDEAPMAYKSLADIRRLIQPTAEVVDHIRPLYNFKAKE